MTIEAQQPGGRAATWHAYLDRLEGLAEVLARRGLRTQLMTPPGRVPSLHVVNPPPPRWPRTCISAAAGTALVVLVVVGRADRRGGPDRRGPLISASSPRAS